MAENQETEVESSIYLLWGSILGCVYLRCPLVWQRGLKQLWQSHSEAKASSQEPWWKMQIPGSPSPTPDSVQSRVHFQQDPLVALTQVVTDHMTINGKNHSLPVLWQEMFPNIPTHVYHPFSSWREETNGVLASAWKLKSLITQSEKRKKNSICSIF